jgi:L-asparaginase / beta-aspartyl-peptidase
MVTERQRRRLAARGERDATGTVGAVCLDADGRLAAATSTGGFCGKPPARVGDSAIFGAGTWAHRTTCAVSATGDGEAFLRVLFAHEIHARMLHGEEELRAAADAALGEVGAAGGRGGAICVDVRGAIAVPLSSDVMYRAWRRAGAATYTALGGSEAGSTAPAPPQAQRASDTANSSSGSV